MMFDPDEMTRYYNERAPEYEKIYFRENPVRRKELVDEAERLRELSRNRSVLDIPCGTGYWTAVMDETANEIVAADLSREMLDQVSLKNFRCPISLVQAEIDRPPFKPGSFDLLALGFWLSHHPRQNYGKLFEVLGNVICETGEIWMIENNPPAEGPQYKVVGEDEHGNLYKERFLDDGTRFVILKNYFSEADLRELLGRFFRILHLTYGEYYWSSVLGKA